MHLLLVSLLILGQCLPAIADDTPFWWYDRTNTLSSRQTMVHLFEWKWTDIANECENFLQNYGYGAVQISPPMEHITINQNNDMPWWVRYQPVSYKLDSRSGTEAELQDMINRCNKVGVRVVVDAVMNHMVGVGERQGADGVGSTANSAFDGTDGVETFPSVPYAAPSFNDQRCHRDIQDSDYQNSAENVRNCRLVGLLDLDQGNQAVRTSLAGYLNKLIDMGVAGFRFDASKHMWPGDLMPILNMTKNLRSDIFGANVRPFAVHEVIDRGGEAVTCGDYLNIGRYTNFNFGAAVSNAAKGYANWQSLSHLGPGYSYGNYEDHDVLNFIDNHDNQRDDNPYVVTYKNGDQYRMAVAFMLAWSYGYPRVMSSFYFNDHNQGPPNNGAGSGFATRSPTFNPDLTCNSDSGWVCEHRWPTIRQMSLFRSVSSGRAAAEVVTQSNRIAFARESAAFFALNGQSGDWTQTFQTTLPPGEYCDQYNGALDNNQCTSLKVSVGFDGKAVITIKGNQVVAVSQASRVDGPHPTDPTPTGYTKTVIFLKRSTNPGEDLFIRGGANKGTNGKTNTCSPGPYQQSSDQCATPIVHNTTVPFFFTEYLTWSQSDNYLDFEGAEEKQGTHDGIEAFGTPLAYSTNDPSAIEYQPYNQYGAGYWIAELLVDCSKLNNGWFELKGYLSPSVGWENNINQGTCDGAVGGKAPYTSINHIARCGFVNVFEWGKNGCTIDML
ncbi:unnamed protein product, partial [Mesorhabditis belari]|uniref:Alpha-amylase n=1 Tax=Mesorhabditis belari TaxID=2138241 RepID=A0AAF3J619_9BILA